MWYTISATTNQTNMVHNQAARGRLQARRERNSGGRNPAAPLKELINRIFGSQWITDRWMVSFPRHPSWCSRSSSRVLVFSIEDGVWRRIPCPGKPTSRVQQASDRRLNDHSGRIILPWPPQVNLCFYAAGSREDLTLVYRNSGVLVGIALALGSDRVLLALHWFPWKDLTTLKHNSGIAEDEIHGSNDGAILIKLALGLSI